MLTDSVDEGTVGGQLGELLGSVVFEEVLEGGECRRRTPQSWLSDEHLYSNLLRLAVHDNLLVMLGLSLHVDLLRLGVRVLGSGGVGLECCRLQLLLLHIELLGLFFR